MGWDSCSSYQPPSPPNLLLPHRRGGAAKPIEEKRETPKFTILTFENSSFCQWKFKLLSLNCSCCDSYWTFEKLVISTQDYYYKASNSSRQVAAIFQWLTPL
ncbi:uncharacterized protein [Mycetomoellerius zeteki]|uniref:uncharacterized protein n=1 Tax=Mycetomoellerius zeteki TaxID=64791 RepID=UPI00084E9CD2|nr:PREDICTED: uncharacterized protein LOC108720706 [Trachymyrmex zeteki]